MNRTQIINTSIDQVNDNQYIPVRLEQNVDVLEVLTLNLKTKDIYRNFNSDYGVLIGRVIANEGIGVPNVKVSIFIPLSEEDETNEDILSIYPYKTPRDVNNEGKRYNLLPRVSEYDNIVKSYKPNQPFGSFPTKPEIVTNRTFLNVYKKYYKFTTVTNENGDYMIFGAPVGLHTVHISVDITDIGKYSMSPKSMVKFLGYPDSYFLDNSTKIKPSIDLDDLPNIETQEIDVNIRPFWGDKENFEIGLTKQDFRIRAEIVNSFIICGSAFSDADGTTWGRDIDIGNNPIMESIRKYIHGGSTFIYSEIRNKLHRFNMMNTINPTPSSFKYPSLSIINKKRPQINEEIYYQDLNGEIVKLDENEYVKYVRDGSFVYEIRCNRDKIIIDESGNEVSIDDWESGGVFKNFYGFIIFDLLDNTFKHRIYDEYEVKPDSTPELIEDNYYFYRDLYSKIQTRIKVPQTNLKTEGIENKQFSFLSVDGNYELINQEWHNQYKKFIGGKIYTVSKFNPIVRTPNQLFPSNVMHIGAEDEVQIINTIDVYNKNFDIEDIEYVSGQISTQNSDFPSNFSPVLEKSDDSFFGGNWLNGSLYLPVITHVSPYLGDGSILKDDGSIPEQSVIAHITHAFGGFRSTSLFTINLSNKYDSIENGGNNPFGHSESQNNILSGLGIENARCLRNDLHWTDFVELKKEDLTLFFEKMENDELSNGFIVGDGADIEPESLLGVYRNGVQEIENEDDIFYGLESCPFDGGKINLKDENEKDPKTYFYFGHYNCLQFLNELNIL